jgi:hypothetical protein
MLRTHTALTQHVTSLRLTPITHAPRPVRCCYHQSTNAVAAAQCDAPASTHIVKSPQITREQDRNLCERARRRRLRQAGQQQHVRQMRVRCVLAKHDARHARSERPARHTRRVDAGDAVPTHVVCVSVARGDAQQLAVGVVQRLSNRAVLQIFRDLLIGDVSAHTHTHPPPTPTNSSD